MFEIREYSESDFQDVVKLIKADPQWHFLVDTKSRLKTYATCLDKSVTFVCLDLGVLCGYIRAIADEGLSLYISELFVKASYRNKGIGKELINIVKERNPEITVYALSDEDEYYEKKGFEKIGSVFII